MHGHFRQSRQRWSANNILQLITGSVQMAQFSEEYIFRTLKIVLMGVLISNVVCYILWPRSGITKLKCYLHSNPANGRNDMIAAMDDYSDVFTLLVRSFLSSSSINNTKFEKLYEDQRKWSGKLRASLQESKYEYYLLGRKEEYLIMHRLVERMEVITPP